jgi:hypothetical protein
MDEDIAVAAQPLQDEPLAAEEPRADFWFLKAMLTTVPRAAHRKESFWQIVSSVGFI